MKNRSRNKPQPRDHLFISYAWEDQAFSRWLALRLTAEGYKVWIDQFKLLGGESYPRDIDEAIKTRTFRVLGLLSRHSIAKPNPLKERTLALNIAKQRGREGFLIPLNVDGLAATDLDWMTSDITFVPFSASWAKGFAQLLMLLERERCPRFEGDGRTIVVRIAATPDCVVVADELLASNACPFTKIPNCITAFVVSPMLQNGTGILYDALRDWSFFSVSPRRVLAFHPPEASLATWLKADAARTYKWRDHNDIEGIDTRNVVVRLLRGCVETRLRRLGFHWSEVAEGFAFPGPLAQTVPLVLPNGKKTKVQHSGERTFFRVGQPKVKYCYRLAIKLTMERNFFAEYALIWRLRFHLTDTAGEPLPTTERLSRRKHLTKNWHNYQWLVRYLAAIQRCADADSLIRVGPPGDTEVVLECRPATFTVGRAIDESVLGPAQELTDCEADKVPFEDNPSDMPPEDEIER